MKKYKYLKLYLSLDNNKSKKIVAVREPNTLAFSSFSCLIEKIGGFHREKGCCEIPERGGIPGNLEDMIAASEMR